VSAAFYCVADKRYFLGAVGLVNSLRLVGHAEPIFLLDCGLTNEQRDLLGPEVNLVPGPIDAAPHVLKAIAPLRHPADVMVLIDVDMIATRSLEPLIAQAAEGKVVGVRDRQQRYFTQWGELPGLAQARPGPYVSSGLVILGGDLGADVLELFSRHLDEVDFELTFWRRNVREYPFLYADQDVLNAILATRVEPGLTLALDQRLAATPPFRGLRILDAATLACAYRDGTRPYVVHQYVRKPWLEATYHGVYSRLLRRLLLGDGLAVTPPEDAVPSRLRNGPRAGAERAGVNARDFLRWHLGDRLPRPIATRIEDLRRRREARGT
jgi:hypothetical protein